MRHTIIFYFHFCRAAGFNIRWPVLLVTATQIVSRVSAGVLYPDGFASIYLPEKFDFSTEIPRSLRW